MQKGHYKCLFCDDVVQWDNCRCLGSTSYPKLCTFFKTCKNLHSLIFKTHSCPFCNEDNAKLCEGSWGNGACEIPGRLTQLRFYDFDSDNWIVFNRREYSNPKTSFIYINRLVKQYLIFESKKRQQLCAERLEWIKCATRISRDLINRDIVRKIAKLLDTEPYGIEVQIENNKK